MQDRDSVKSELQTLIMLEQQQASALHSINNKADMGGNPMGVGSLGMPGFGLYGPSTYSGGGVGGAGFFKAGGDLYDRAVGGVINSINNVNANMRNFALTASLDSASPLWGNQSKLSAEARQLNVSRAGEKFATGTAAAMSGAVNIASMFAGGLTTALGGAAIGAAIDVGADQLKQNYAYDQYLTQNSYRFINMIESNNKRGVGGFSRNERWDTANFLRHFNTEMKISDDDTMTILKGFTEGDLLREAKDVETFKSQMTSLTKSLKTMALTLNESYEEIAELMGEMKKKGIDVRNYESYAATSKVVGGLIGADASDVMQFQLSTASSLTAGTMLSTDRMMGSVSSAQAYLGKMYDEALAGKDLSQDQALRYNRIVNRGGIDAAASDYLSATSGILRNQNMMDFYGAAFFDWDGSSWNFNRATFEEYASGKKTAQEIYELSKNKFNSSGAAGTYNWRMRGAELLENSLSDVSDRAMLTQGFLDSIKNNVDGMAGMDYASIMQLTLGLSDQDSIFVSDVNEFINNNKGYYNKVISASVAQSFMDQLNSNRMGLGYSLKNFGGRVVDTVGDFFSPIGEGWNNISEWVQDKWYGKEYYDVKKLWADTDFTRKDLGLDLDAMAQTFRSTAEALDGSSSLSKSLSSLADSVEKLKGSVDSASAKIESQHGISGIAWGNLTDYKSYMRDFSMWKQGDGQANYIQNIYDALNTAGGFGIEATYSGVYSESQREAIMQKSMSKYKAIMGSSGSITLDDYNFAKAFEGYNKNVRKMEGFDEVYSGRFLLPSGANATMSFYSGVEDKRKSFSPEEAKNNEWTSDKLTELTDEINALGDMEKGFSVAREVLSGTDSHYNYGDYQYTRNKDGTYNIRNIKKFLSPYEYKNIGGNGILQKIAETRDDLNEISKFQGAFEAAQTAYTAMTGLVGLDSKTQKSIENMYKNGSIENLFTYNDSAKALLAGHMFEGVTIGSNIGSLESLKDQVLGYSWVKNLGGTQIVGDAFDSWASENGIGTGSRISEDSLKELVDYLVAAATGSGDIANEAKESRDNQQAEDIKGIRDMLYHYFEFGPMDGTSIKKSAKDIRDDYEADRGDTYQGGSEVNAGGSTSGGKADRYAIG